MNQALVVYREELEAEPYRHALALAGIPVLLARVDAVPRLANLSGLVLTGGTDVDPSFYGEERGPRTDEPDTARDNAELKLLEEALGLEIPVLAICRGLQLMNVFHGGSLVQHLANAAHHQRRTADRALPAHNVSIEPGTLLESITGPREMAVNSRHHQAIGRLGKGLAASARDDSDGLTEAIERPDRLFVLGVQWHPENQAPTDVRQLKIFERFGAAMLEHQAASVKVIQGAK